MAQNTFALMTNVGRAKEAAALANGTSVVITHIAIGDGATVPSGGETALYHEVARKAISGHGTVVGASNTAYFDIFLEADEGPYTIREAGLIDQDGDLIAIARYDPPISKPIPSSGQTVEGTIRIEVAFSNIANVTIVVDPSFSIPMQRLTRLPWLPVISMSEVIPPATPNPGDVYLVPAGATGAWSGQGGKIAEYTVAGWSIITPPNGHGISLPDGRIFERIAGAYVEKLALDVQSGKWTYAVAGGTNNALTATLAPAPAGLVAGMGICLKCTAANTGAATLNVNGFGAVPIVTGFGEDIGYGDLNDGSFAQLIYTGTAWMLAGISASQVKTNLSTATTFYVRPNGNDSNSGLANTDASAFQTIQGAWNAILRRYNPSGYDVTIQLGTPGTYEGASFEGSTVNLVLRGDPSNPSNYVITRQSAKQWHIRSAMYSVVLDGVKISKSVAGIYGTYTIFGGVLELRTVILEQTGAGAGAGQYHTYTFNGGYLSLAGSITVIGSASAPFLAQNNGIIGTISGASITLQGSPVWTVGFASVQQARAQLGFLTFVGSATGNRYTVSQNGVIDVAGQGANFLPGSVAGNAVTGGLYV